MNSPLLPDTDSSFKAPTPVDVELTVIVVSFNTRKMTIECLRSVVEQTRITSYEIIVVDNNSHDDSCVAIRSEFPNVTLIELAKNIGFARANNLAAQKAQGHQILLLNPDTVVLDGAIDRLISFAKRNPSSLIWGGRTVSADGLVDPTSVWRRMSLWSVFCNCFFLSRLAPNSAIFNSEQYGGWMRNSVRTVDIVTGCLLLIERGLWRRLGGFDPMFFMYGEEADLCFRAQELGASPIFTPEATIVHYGGASNPSSFEKRKDLFRAKITLIDRQFSGFTRRLSRALIILHPLVRWRANQLLAMLFGIKRRNSETSDWKKLWKQRRDWIGGYTSDKT